MRRVRIPGRECNSRSVARFRTVTFINTGGALLEGVANPKFYYDADGNMDCVTARSSCDGNAARTYSWTSFNMVEEIQKGTTTAVFTYTPEHQRFSQTIASGTIEYMSDPAGNVMAERFAGTGSATTPAFARAGSGAPI